MDPDPNDESRATAPRHAPMTIRTGGWVRELTHQKLGLFWLAAFVAGAVGIWLSPSASWRSFALPLVIMLVFMAYGLQLERKNTGNFADSLYFLGFLWTLVALISALRGQELTSRTVFPAFGYALVTTAAGMLSRLLVIQFQETIPDRVADAQRDIDADVVALRDALRGARSELTALQVATEGTIREYLGKLQEDLRAAHKEIPQLHRDAVRAALGALDESIQAVTSRITELRIPDQALKEEFTKLTKLIDALGRRMSRATETMAARLEAGENALGEAWGRAQQRVDGFDLPTEGLAKRFDAAGERLAEAGAGIANKLENLLASSGLEEAVQALADMTGRVRDEQEKVVAGNAAAAAKLGTAADEVGRLDKALGELRTSIVALGSVVDDMATKAREDLGGRFDEAQQTIESARAAGDSLHRTVSDVLSFVESHLRGRQDR